MRIKSNEGTVNSIPNTPDIGIYYMHTSIGSDFCQKKSTLVTHKKLFPLIAYHEEDEHDLLSFMSRGLEGVK